MRGAPVDGGGADDDGVRARAPVRGVVHALRGEVGDARAEAARVPAVDRLAGLLRAWLDGAADLPGRLAAGAADEVAEVRIASARLALPR